MTIKYRNSLLFFAASICIMAFLTFDLNSKFIECVVPKNWVRENGLESGLMPRTLIIIESEDKIVLNRKLVSMHDLIDILDGIDRFNPPEFLDIRIFSGLPCHKANNIVKIIDQSAGCGYGAICKLEYFD